MSKYDYIWLQWMEGELSSTEHTELQGDPNYAELMKTLEAAKRIPVPVFQKDDVWNSIQAAKLNAVDTATIRPLKKRTPLFRIMAAAASIALLAMFLLTRNPYTTISTSVGEQIAYVLPDGSQVQLNAASELRFRKKNWSNEREVQLDGEAFFLVDVAGPFKVLSPNSEVSVLGTSFNVKDRNGLVEVACYTGEVNVIYLLDAKKTSLAKGETVRYATGTSAELVKDSSRENPSWLNGESTYKAIPLSEVLADLERQFDVQIITANVNDSRLFTGSFIHNDVDLALKMVLEPMQISWQKTGNSVVLAQ